VWPQNHSDGFSSVWASKPMTTVCEWSGRKTTQTVFTGFTSKQVATVFSSLVSKLVATIFSSLAPKLVAMVFSSLTSKLVATSSPDLALKPVVGFLVEPQNQGGREFFGLGLKTNSFSLVIWGSKSPRRFFSLCIKTMCPSVCWLNHKTDGGRLARDTR
jgi:hypothetical protein